jgi:hypothetical protein
MTGTSRQRCSPVGSEPGSCSDRRRRRRARLGTERAARIDQATPGELRRMRFELGSMAAKIEAACRFVEAPGNVAATGALNDARRAPLRGGRHADRPEPGLRR